MEEAIVPVFNNCQRQLLKEMILYIFQKMLEAFFEKYIFESATSEVCIYARKSETGDTTLRLHEVRAIYLQLRALPIPGEQFCDSRRSLD